MSHQVVIIGAGMAGLKAGIELNKNGVDTIILEAKDRLGGRLHSQTVAGFPVDLGASWFHDCLTNPLLAKYQNHPNVTYFFDDAKTSVINSNGLFDSEPMQPVVDEFYKYVQLKHKSGELKDDSIHNVMNEYIAERRPYLTEDQIKYTPQLIRFIELWFGSCWDQTSAVSALEMDHDGRNAFLTSSWVSVYQNELKEFPRERIYTEKAVNKVERLRNNKLIVRCADGSKYTCNDIIVTIPQPCLTSYDYATPGAIEWVPELPKSFTNHYPKMSFAALGKVGFQFEDIFWPVDSDRVWCIADPDTKSIEYLQDKGQPLQNPVFPENGTLSKKPNAWEYPVLFVNVAKFTGKPIVIALMQAPITHYIESRESDAEVWDYFEPYFLKFVNNDRMKKVPKPKSIVKTTWTQDPFARGSYCGGKVGGDADASVELFIKGLPNVRFAGEHTIIQGNGCAHGAWLSGKREADYLLKRYNKL